MHFSTKSYLKNNRNHNRNRNHTKHIKTMFGNAAAAAFLKILNFFFTKIEYGLYVLYRFDVLISKMIFKK
jgi:hypothetical protein